GSAQIDENNSGPPDKKTMVVDNGVSIQLSKGDDYLRKHTIYADMFGGPTDKVTPILQNKGRLVLSGEYGTLLNGLEKPGQVDIENSFLRIINKHNKNASVSFQENHVDLELFQKGSDTAYFSHVKQLFTIGGKDEEGIYDSGTQQLPQQAAIVLEPKRLVYNKKNRNLNSTEEGYALSFYLQSNGKLDDDTPPAFHIENDAKVVFNAPVDIGSSIVVENYLQLKTGAVILDNDGNAYNFRQIQPQQDSGDPIDPNKTDGISSGSILSQISGYIQTQFKNSGFLEYNVPEYLNPGNGYNLTIIPSQINNNIITNIHFSYRTSGQPGEKLRIQIGYNVFALDYEEVICDETMGTLNTSNLEQPFNFNYINKAKGSYPHYYWIKFQKILDSNVENLDLGNDYNTKILNSVGNLIMLQEVVGTNVSEITNTTVWSQGAENKLSYNLGNIGINTENPTERLEIDGSVKIIGENSFLNIPSNPPTSSNSSGKQGDITWDDNYIYVCVAENSWKRTLFFKDNW
ncbi:hypothetical protein N8996_07410, partial [Candidatus Poseidonia alphae]|nr:hypothetical protein [Candidatus Poseidonia alphae]